MPLDISPAAIKAKLIQSTTLIAMLTKIHWGIDRLYLCKSPGSAGFLPKVVKEMKNKESLQLATIFNASLETGTVSGY